MSKNADNIVRIPCSLGVNFYKYWLGFLTPFHRLTPRETDVLATVLNTRRILSESIHRDDILDAVLFSDETKRKMREELGMSPTHLQVILSKLKTMKIIDNDRVNKRFIPPLRKDGEDFKMLLLFDFSSDV